MFVIPTVLWLLKAALRQPAGWILFLLVGALWPSLRILMSLGLTTTGGPPQAALLQISFLAAVGGATLGLYTLCKHDWLLLRTGPLKSACVEWAAIATSAGVFWLASMAVALMETPWEQSLVMLSRGLLACLHLAFLGSLWMALSRSWTQELRAGALPLLAWVLPAIPAGEGLFAATLRQTCEIARYFEFPLAWNSTAPLLWGSLLPMMGLALLRIAQGTTRGEPAPPKTPCATQS